MKKVTFIIIVAALLIALMSSAGNLFAAADEAVGSDFLDAIMSEVTLDGLPYEYVLDKKLSKMYIGASWSLKAEMLYIGAVDPDASDYKIDIGGKSLKIEGDTASGIAGALVKRDGICTEIGIPIKSLSLGYNGTYGTVSVKLTQDGSKEPLFNGRIIFTDYLMGIAYNDVQEIKDSTGGSRLSHGAIAGGLASNDVGENLWVAKNSGYRYVLYDSAHERLSTRAYTICGGKQFEDNMELHYEFDLNVISMPYSAPFIDGLATFDDKEESRIWIILKYGKSEMVYLNIINTADGLKLLVQNEGDDPTVIPLGREEGEKFTLSLDLNKKYELTVRVDGKTVGGTDKTINRGSTIGVTKGVFVFNIARNSPLDIKWVEVEYSNISASSRSSEYSLDGLLALSATAVDTSNAEEELTESDGAEEEYKLGGVSVISKEAMSLETTEEATYVITTDTVPPDADEGGCSSSVSAIAAIAAIAVIAAIGTAKRKKASDTDRYA